MPVGEVFLGAFLAVLFDRLTSPELRQFTSQEGIRSKLNNWERKLRMINALLKDAEEKQLTDGAVKVWLDDLQDLAYDVEDILDEFATEVLRRKLKAEDHASTSKVISRLIPPCLTGCTPSAVKFNISMGSKINAITRRLEELCNQRTELGLEKIAGGTSTAVWSRPDSTSVQVEPAVCGRDQDKENILKMVLSDEPNDANFRVIPIVGMGGLGKTTLARAVFNHDAVQHFNPRAWVCISDDFDVLRISKALLESITSQTCDLQDLNAVQVQLKNKVAGKKFLLVLDDVWNDKYELWEVLKSPFMAGAPGSKMIVTTRSVKVALTMEQGEYYRLERLTNEACWDIFKMHVSGNQVITRGQNLNLIREKVIEKCRGLPLAARTLGGLLRTKQTDDEWKDVLTGKVWDSSDSSDIHPVLKLSYYHLPSHLKRCFSYCAIVPKDYEFVEMDIILLWMAEGLIQPSKSKPLEDVGRQYFRELLLRSIFQQSTSDVSKFVMHDLVNDLAQSISGDTSFILEDQLSLPSQNFKRIRHASYSPRTYEVKKRIEAFHGVENLRTFLPLRKSAFIERELYFASITVWSDLLLKLKKLRVLSLAYYDVPELPDSVGDLTHLRFLDLSYTGIRTLPESVSLLYNLQVLKLRGCKLKKWPSNIGNLTRLSYLDISKSNTIREMPVGIGKLKNLRTLSDFIVSKDNGSSLKELRELKFLCGKLVISNLENMLDFQDTRGSILSDKELKVLGLHWISNFDPSRDVMIEENVLDMLQPPENLEELTINNYGGQKFSSWIGDPLILSNLVDLRLDGCENCVILPSLALLRSLKTLTIENMKSLKRIDSEIYGRDCSKSFQLLEYLYLSNLPEWEHWDTLEENDHIERFPCLRELYISQCSKLIGRLPKSLPSLKRLEINECEQLMVSFSNLPMLRVLQINRCKGMVCGNPIDSGARENLNFPVFKNWTVQGFQKIENLTIIGCDELGHLWSNEIPCQNSSQGLYNFTSLKELNLYELPNLVSVPDGLFSILSRLEIRKCNALASLHEGLKHNDPHLEYLRVESCSSLTCIVRGHLPSSLKELSIEDCEKLLCVVDDREDNCSTSSPSPSSSSLMRKEDMDNTTTSLLKRLYISSCPSLTCLSSTDQPFPATLTNLEIWSCSNVKSLLSRGQLYKALQSILISRCPKLESIVDRFDNNASLESIRILDCENLKSIPEGLHTLSRLRRIDIIGPSLLLFPEGGFPNTPNLSIAIRNCEKLQALPNRMHKLNSLQHLCISNCPSIIYSPHEGFTTNLTSLAIGDGNFYKHLSDWGFHKLTALRSLYIDGCTDAVCFPQEDVGMVLPSSLIHLTILNLLELNYLFPKGFQNLSSLESLWIQNCPHLTSLPSLPSSLEELSILSCPNVTFLPHLPSSLLELSIRECPMLKKQCKRDEGKEWSKIVHVPLVEIDWKSIYEEEE